MQETNKILWDRHGPRLEMTNRGGDPKYRYALNIRDLNPPRDFTWCFSRWQMIKIGLWFVRRAIFAKEAGRDRIVAAAPNTPPPPKPKR